MLAGHDTTSTAVVWTLYALSQAPELQHKLRAELSSVPSDTPNMDDLNALPYLEWVVRESLRLYSPIANSFRIATRDTEIPVGKPFTDRYGRQVDRIRIRKDQGIFIPIAAVNRTKEIWGEDAHEFRYNPRLLYISNCRCWS